MVGGVALLMEMRGDLLPISTVVHK